MTRIPIDIDQSHELVELNQLVSLNGKSWRVVQIDPGPAHFGYRVAGGTGLNVELLREALHASDPVRYAECYHGLTVSDCGIDAEAIAREYAALSSEALIVPLRVTVWLEETG